MVQRWMKIGKSVALKLLILFDLEFMTECSKDLNIFFFFKSSSVTYLALEWYHYSGINCRENNGHNKSASMKKILAANLHF